MPHTLVQYTTTVASAFQVADSLGFPLFRFVVQCQEFQLQVESEIMIVTGAIRYLKEGN